MAPIMVPVTDPATDPITDPATDPVTDPATDPVTDPITEPVAGPVTEPVTDPVTVPVPVPLTPLQEKALEYSRKKARIIVRNMHLTTLARFRTLGYTEDDLTRVGDYIRRKMQIVIHVNLDKVLDHWCRDPHYRNQFETGTSGGALSRELRTVWEDTLFGKIYHDAQGPERVKYGALNITNDVAGVRSCHGYGDSYLVLRNEVKDRSTFVYGDSCRQDLHLATFRDCEHILYYYDDETLAKVVRVATGQEPGIVDRSIYTELQVHGPVRLVEDVEVLVCHPRHRQDRRICDLLAELERSHGVRIMFAEPSTEDSQFGIVRTARRKACRRSR